MYLLVGSPKISVHVIGTSGWLYQELLVHTHATKNCFVIVSLLGTKR